MEQFIEIINDMALYGEVLWKIDYDTIITEDGNYVLAINYTTIINKLKKHYYQQIFDKSSVTFVGDIENSNDSRKIFSLIDTYISSEWFNEERFANAIKNKTYCIQNDAMKAFFCKDNPEYKVYYKAALLNIFEIQKMGYNIDNLLSNDLCTYTNM